MMATIYRAAGTVETVAPADGRFTLDEVWAIVGGWVEMVRLEVGFLLVDEDGRAKRLPQNPNATKLAGQPIVGTALHTDETEFD